MKLPEYDNRPAPGEPLFSDPSSNSQLDDIKFTLLGFGITGGTIICFGAAALLLLLALLH
jgi:hypothetical protein